ncbi:5-formyltetrahydrofolate cyclo-ligase [Shouchella sp. JSM 1781072]|uniref:5-formyltetrahydrofolate cyclo-ligase n=1 Tax=Bacillaceae TaxID=186817 RepID=UPI000C06D7CA|nr:5-formyltetrahydrofolate cyclo-ligase [Bacillus sp. Marseille-P3800]
MDKQEIRELTWATMTEEKVARFPFPIKGRIPNFKGAEAAAAIVRKTDLYQQAKIIKVNPDSPQLPLRAAILADGKTLFVPTPRLKDGFIQVKPESVPSNEYRKAASLTHIKSYGKIISLKDLPQIDLMVMGSVTVDRDGRRLGKGAGYADREYAILKELGQKDIPVLTTIHSCQLCEEELPMNPYDVTMDYIATEKELIQTNSTHLKPSGIFWDQVSPEELEDMPILQELKTLTSSRR